MSKKLKTFVTLIISFLLMWVSINTLAAPAPKYVNATGGCSRVFVTTSDGKLFIAPTIEKKLISVKDITNVKMASEDIFGNLWLLDRSGYVFSYKIDQEDDYKFTERERIDDLGKVVSISVGSEGIYALKSDGTVWGVNFKKEISKVEGLSGITSISVRDWDAVALKKDGTVWQWSNPVEPDKYHKIIPVSKVEGISGIKAISVGAESGLALKKDGTVWQWDYYTPELFTPKRINQLSGIKVIEAGRMDGYAVDSKGFVWRWGLGSSTEELKLSKINGLSGIVMIAASGRDVYDGFSEGSFIAIDKNNKIKYFNFIAGI